MMIMIIEFQIIAMAFCPVSNVTYDMSLIDISVFFKCQSPSLLFAIYILSFVNLIQQP